MTGTHNSILENLYFSENPVDKTARAYIIDMGAGGKKLTLYLKLDGGFMYYYHSW